jgi:hypothetical protein
MVEEEAPFQNVKFGKNKNVIMDPNGARYKE